MLGFVLPCWFTLLFVASLPSSWPPSSCSPTFFPSNPLISFRRRRLPVDFLRLEGFLRRLDEKILDFVEDLIFLAIFLGPGLWIWGLVVDFEFEFGARWMGVEVGRF